MKKITRFIGKGLLSVLGSCAVFIGIVAVTPATMLSTYQPKCPEELLK